MTHVLDSSAIVTILKRLKGKSVEVLEGNVTLDLAAYELGNLIWKECALRKIISPEEAVNRAEQMARTLEVIELAEIGSAEDFKDVMRLATELKLTFYDASYLHVAKERGLPLATEDEELRDKAERAGFEAVAASELMKASHGRRHLENNSRR